MTKIAREQLQNAAFAKGFTDLLANGMPKSVRREVVRDLANLVGFADPREFRLLGYFAAKFDKCAPRAFNIICGSVSNSGTSPSLRAAPCHIPPGNT
ncbi:hypothetical protein shim_02910 [Shimia sp. SK013]|nr:hypothetical protein shim_02910 [Shimia sp. SK013]